MKKTRLFLTGAAIVTIATSAFAFKAFHPVANVWCNNAQNICSKSVNFQSVGTTGGNTNPCGDGAHKYLIATSAGTSACPTNMTAVFAVNPQ